MIVQNVDRVKCFAICVAARVLSHMPMMAETDCALAAFNTCERMQNIIF